MRAAETRATVECVCCVPGYCVVCTQQAIATWGGTRAAPRYPARGPPCMSESKDGRWAASSPKIGPSQTILGLAQGAPPPNPMRKDEVNF